MQSAHEQRRELGSLTARATRDLRALFAYLDGAPIETIRATLADVIPVIAIEYGDAAAALAVDWYDEQRAAAAAAGVFAASPSLAPNADRYDALVRYGIGPLFGDSADPESRALALSLVGGGLQRIIANLHRDTIADNAKRDPAGPRFARLASPDSCAFCRLLATRGPVYYSEATALSVGGKRRQRPLGSRYHDWCDCIAVPVWRGKYQEPGYVAEWRQAYEDSPLSNGVRDLSTATAAMREVLDAK